LEEVLKRTAELSHSMQQLGLKSGDISRGSREHPKDALLPWMILKTGVIDLTNQILPKKFFS